MAEILDRVFELELINRSVIPSGGGTSKKAPIVDWTIYQKEIPSLDQCTNWNETLHPSLWGIVTGLISGVIVFDTDSPEASEIFHKAGLKPHVKTKRGEHYYFKHPGDHPINNKVGVLPHVDLRGDGGFVNCLGENDSASYQMLTLPTNEVLYDMQQLPLVVKEALLKPTSQTAQFNDVGEKIPQGQQDNWLYKRACAYRGKGDTEDIIASKLRIDSTRLDQNPSRPYTDKDFMRIAKSSAKYTPNPNNLEELEKLEVLEELENIEDLENLDKFEGNRSSRKDLKNLNSLIIPKSDSGTYHEWSKQVDKWLELHKDETFDLDTICRQIGATDSKSKELISRKLWYEVNITKLLEKSNRIYRYINNGINNIYWYDCGDAAEYFDVTFPSNHQIGDMSYFSFQDAVRISPGAVIVIAGQTNAGKSTLARNLVWDNMDKHHVRYMVSQTSAAAFARYAAGMKWAEPMRAPRTPKFDLVEQYENFQDVILKDGFNIVDWLDADKVEYFKIGTLIKAMQTKVGDGVLAVMIQKNSGSEFGDGGEKSAKWADLYLTLNYNRDKNFTRLNIVKAKEWIGNRDPNGKSFGFEIINYGSQLAHIREVKKCPRCWGDGKRQGHECDNCNGIGWVDDFVVHR